MKKYGIIFLGILLLFVIYACASMGFSGESTDEKLRVENTMHRDTIKSAHHTLHGFQNYPLVEVTAAKGILFYLRRFWHSVFLYDVPTDHALSESQALSLRNSITGDAVTWLGHASFLIRIAGKTMLTDPFLSEFASPLSWAGPRRMVPPGISLDKLPPIDFLIVSHNHYDHLDDETVRKLPNKENIQVFVPLGLEPFFAKRGYSNITELDWYEEMTIDELTLVALPAVHESARSLNDHNKTLWASWAIISPNNRLYFVGDSGYSSTIFKEINNTFGGFNYALLPIGAYQPRELMWMSHLTPEEAVQVGKQVRATTLIASHWGTINLSDEPPWDPPKRFNRAGIEQGFGEKQLWVLKIGETRSLKFATMF